jgi:hypothetical protein
MGVLVAGICALLAIRVAVIVSRVGSLLGDVKTIGTILGDARTVGTDLAAIF